jgi:hypothetical protein
MGAPRGREGGSRAIELRLNLLILSESLGFCTLPIVRNSKYPENTTFRKIALFPSQPTFRMNIFTPISESSQARNQCKICSKTRLSFLHDPARTRLALNAVPDLVFQNLFCSRTPNCNFSSTLHPPPKVVGV